MMLLVLNQKLEPILLRGWIFISGISLMAVGLLMFSGGIMSIVVIVDSSKSPTNVTLLHPKVRMLGDDAAMITYCRIIQSILR